jgi:uncharacterized protein DUF6308
MPALMARWPVLPNPSTSCGGSAEWPARWVLMPYRPTARARAAPITSRSLAPAGKYATAWKPAASPVSATELATDAEGRAHYSGAYFERIGGGGDRPEAAGMFAAEDLLAVTMLSVRIEGYHALEILRYRARELNDLLAQVPNNVALQDPGAGTHIAKSQPEAMGRNLRYRATPREQQDRSRRGRQTPGAQAPTPAPRL